MRSRALFIISLVAGIALVAARRPPSPAEACDPDNAGLIVAPGFCATLFATVPGVRHIAVAPNGDVFAAGGRAGITALRDRKGTGHSDTSATFGTGSGTGIAIGPDAIYFAPNDRVIRFSWHPGSLTPADQGTVVVGGLPTGGHTAKTLALAPDGHIFVDHGSASNSCQQADRIPKSPGKMPCPELAIRAGTWRYDARKSNQSPADGERWTTGVRNGMAIAVEPGSGSLWGATHGRDDLRGNLGVSDKDNAEKPAEEFAEFAKGIDLGWPYCYYDPIEKKKVLAPEYGGDGVKQGECAGKTQPAIAFPAHWAPMQLAFAPARTSFGSEYARSAFLAFHGSWDRAPLPQEGYRIVFIPFRAGKPTGGYTTFAQGAGTQVRFAGVAMAPDGSALFVAADAQGKIWRIVPTTPR